MSTSGKDPVRGLPQTDEESSRSYFTISKHLRPLLPPFVRYRWDREWETSPACRFVEETHSHNGSDENGAFRCLRTSFPNKSCFWNRDRWPNWTYRGVLEEDLRWWSWLPTEEPWKYVIYFFASGRINLSLTSLRDNYLPVFSQWCAYILDVGIE